MFGFGILSGLTFLPLVGAAFILTQRGDDEATLRNIRWAALFTTIAVFVLSLVVWQRFDASSAAFQLVEERPWFGAGHRLQDGRRRLLAALRAADHFPDALRDPRVLRSRSRSASGNI